MTQLSDEQLRRKIIESYAQPVAHLRQLRDTRRLGLVLGAGVSLGAQLPSWQTLVDYVAQELSKQGISAPGSEQESLPIRIQVLFGRFREKVFAESAQHEQTYCEAEVAARWRRLVHQTLYAGVSDIDAAIAQHPYLSVLAALAYRLPLVVSYNFDDLLERALANYVKNLTDSNTIGYYTAWGPNFLLQEGRPVVYHPNGFLPYDLIDRYSDDIVLTEEALSNQIIGFGLGEYAALLDYFSRTPCLFIGFSLEDSALRTLLRHSVRRSPGIVHYYVRWVSDQSMSSEQMRQIRDTNFELFNVITLFLTGEELRAMLNLIATVSSNQFHDEFVTAGYPDRYLYYVAGPVSVGKTSVISRLRGVDVVDEWLTPRKPQIAKASVHLSDVERKEVDLWIMDQVRRKNYVFRQATWGIYVMDRAPLDAFAFTPLDQQQAKADLIWDEVCRGRTARKVPLEKGTIVLLTGRADDLEMRQRWRGRSGDKAYIEEQQKQLIRTYSAGAACAFEVDTAGQPIDMVARRLLRVIHLHEYREFDFDARLDDYRSGKA